MMAQDAPLLASGLAATELAATLLQGAITTGLAGLSAHLYLRYQRRWFAWFAVAWGIYVLRLLCITNFLISDDRRWLYWHQVTTGWTAIALLWASLVFLREPRVRPAWLLVLLFPPLWSSVAIYRLDNFLLAALPAVLFLSGATVWTGLVFLRHHRVARSSGARLLAIAFLLWGVHHLDYPFLRARGAWAPWGYYLDICFELLVGAGLVLLVLDDLRRGVRALSSLSADLQRREPGSDPLALLLTRPLALPGVRGSALYAFGGEAALLPAESDALAGETRAGERTLFDALTGDGPHAGRFVRGAGTCTEWTGSQPTGTIADALRRLESTRRPQVAAASGDQPFVAVLPVGADRRLVGALVMTGDVRNPFTALDDDFLLALGQQVGAALEQAYLDRQLTSRTRALEALSLRMVQQHEDERRRLSRELHDETAQVFSAVKMQLEGMRTALVPAALPRLERLLALVDTGIRSIRNVTSALRPALLDDLGLLPALRSLVSEFSARTGLQVAFDAPVALPALTPEADLALFRALQEALSNVARHADATTVQVTLSADDGRLLLRVHDDGRGFAAGPDGRLRETDARMGITGMRERIHAIGGQVQLSNRTRGAEVRIAVPLPVPEAA